MSKSQSEPSRANVRSSEDRVRALTPLEKKIEVGHMPATHAATCCALPSPAFFRMSQHARDEMEKATGLEPGTLSRPVSVGSVHSVVLRERMRMQVGQEKGAYIWR